MAKRQQHTRLIYWWGWTIFFAANSSTAWTTESLHFFNYDKSRGRRGRAEWLNESSSSAAWRGRNLQFWPFKWCITTEQFSLPVIAKIYQSSPLQIRSQSLNQLSFCTRHGQVSLFQFRFQFIHWKKEKEWLNSYNKKTNTIVTLLVSKKRH